RYSFFFQAEDGIRDSSVTGVQTCALPISPGAGNLDLHWSETLVCCFARTKPDRITRAQAIDHQSQLFIDFFLVGSDDFAARLFRSEERRVGKECRLCWWWYQ